MTESSFPFEQQAERLPFDDRSEPGGRKPVVLVGGLVGALVLAAGGYLFLAGDAAEQDVPVPARAPQAAAPIEAVPAHQVVPPKSEGVVGRNPFKVLYVEPAAATAGTTTTGTPTGTGTGATSGTTGGTTTGGTTGGTTTGGTTGGTAPTEQPKTPPKYLTVKEVDSTANQVTFTLVDRAAEKPEDVEQTVVVKPGEVFATYFKLLGYGTLLDANNQPRDCTDLQYGDARIKLCEGESYQVG